MAGVLSRFFFTTATTIQQLKYSSDNENTVKSTAFWLSVWKKWCLEKGIAEEIENYALRARAILLVFKKNLLVLIYSKLHSKSCDYLYKANESDVRSSIKEIKNAPSALFSCISTQEFLRTRGKC